MKEGQQQDRNQRFPGWWRDTAKSERRGGGALDLCGGEKVDAEGGCSEGGQAEH